MGLMYLREGGTSSFYDLIIMAKEGLDAFTKSEGEKSNTTPYSYSSSAAAAAKLIAIFPVLCSSNVSNSTASLMVKQAERKGCLSLQLALTAVNATDAQTGFEYLQKFHQNLGNTNATLRDYEIMMSKYLHAEMQESGYISNINEFYMTTEDTRWFVNYLKEAFTDVYDEDFYNPLSLNDFAVTESADGYTVTIDEYKKLCALGEANNRRTNGTTVQLQDSDIKKMNEAVPAIMVVRFYNKEAKVETQFLIGVKARLIPADCGEILNKIVTNNRDGHGLTNLIRVLTGELKFARDYLFAIDRAKEDISAAKKKGSNQRIWKELEDRSRNAKFLLSQNKTNYASAITTVVISSEDADLLFKEYNIDIREPKNAKRFMQSYNLYGFVIVNDAEEVAWFMYDPDSEFEKIAYTMLERESNDGIYKKIVNMVSKVK